MAMTVQIDLLTGAGPSAAAVGSVNNNREDSASGTTPVPVPTATGTNFSWVKSYQPEITAVAGLTMTNIRVGKSGNESTGMKFWHNTTNAAYTQATLAPTSTGDNNSTAPTINGDTAVAMPLTSAPPAVYSAGGHTTVGRKGNIVEVTVGVDATCPLTGNQTLPALVWSWTEA